MNDDPCLTLEAIAQAPRPSLPELRRRLWSDWGKGKYDDETVERLRGAIDARALVPVRMPGKRRQRFAEGVRGERRRHARRLAYSGPMPPALAALFTTCELAALRIVGDEWKRHGVCAITVKEIADRACIGASTAKRAIREARRLGLLLSKENQFTYARSLPTEHRVASAEWAVWLRHGGGGQREATLGIKNIEGAGKGPQGGGKDGVRKKTTPVPARLDTPRTTTPQDLGHPSSRPRSRQRFDPFPAMTRSRR